MPAPPRITAWLKTAYVRPQINPEWLDACCDYLIGEMGLNPGDFEPLRAQVEEQFLQSSLADSAIPNTGLPAPDSHDIRIKDTLCEVVALTEIGHSAFSLKNVRQARVDKEDLAGLAGDMDDGEDYSVPKYPRSMLRFELSDGTKTMRAIEYRKIPQLDLGVTPLGTKIYLKDVKVRRGIIYLEPNGIQIKGYQTEELEDRQDQDFVRGLRLRMRLPEEDPNEQPNPNPNPRPQPPPNRPDPPANRAPAVNPPAPAPPRANPPPPRVNPPPPRANQPPNSPAAMPPSSAPVVDLDPEDLDIDLDYEDSYSIGDGNGGGGFGDEEDYDDGEREEEDFEIDEAFLHDLEEAEQKVMTDASAGARAGTAEVEEVLDLEEESQVEILDAPGAPVVRGLGRVEEVIDISD